MKEPYEWTEADLINIVKDGENHQESVHLEFKACDALGKSDGKKNEVSKDVSAFANSDGGTIVYGIIEKAHVPEKLDGGYDQNDISKEWLEQVINSRIAPKIDGIRINPIHLETTSSGRYAYVVCVPQSNTAHQASDKRYYKRFNFEATPMEDYEIRDVMFRVKHPRLEAELVSGHSYSEDRVTWKLIVRNTGVTAVQKFAVDFEIPEFVVWKARGTHPVPQLKPVEETRRSNIGYVRFRIVNFQQANPVVHSETTATEVVFPSDSIDVLMGKLYINPKELLEWEKKRITGEDPDVLKVYWCIFADDAPPRSGEKTLDPLANSFGLRPN